ncbi:hypothetical protein [Embleya sp. NPDC059237]|uniref:hypothetical protein n=1 Tax=Embleya sp. NPDC059237 TaxID=3346784 RepID=UPI0036973CBD
MAREPTRAGPARRTRRRAQRGAGALVDGEPVVWQRHLTHAAEAGAAVAVAVPDGPRPKRTRERAWAIAVGAAAA